MSALSLEVLDKNRLRVFKELKAFRRIGVLAGGTALALQLNHRRSEDFDIFVPKPIDKTISTVVKKVFGTFLEKTLDTSDQLTFITSNNVSITFVSYYYSPLKPLVKTDCINLYALDDLISNKAITIGRRGVWRDYVDIFYVLQNKITSLDKIIKDAEQRFGSNFSRKLFLEQLCYFSDLEIVKIEFIKKYYHPDEIKHFLTTEVKKYTKKSLSII